MSASQKPDQPNGKSTADQNSAGEDEQITGSYYYDDTTGYEIYQDDAENEGDDEGPGSQG
jgi:hypothetical protein